MDLLPLMSRKWFSAFMLLLISVTSANGMNGIKKSTSSEDLLPVNSWCEGLRIKEGYFEFYSKGYMVAFHPKKPGFKYDVVHSSLPLSELLDGRLEHGTVTARIQDNGIEFHFVVDPEYAVKGGISESRACYLMEDLLKKMSTNRP